jgi:hypothetical protein
MSGMWASLLVAQDRKENEEIASLERLGGTNQQLESTIDNTDDNEDINPDYF